MLANLNKHANEAIKDQLLGFPFLTVRSKLDAVMKNRGLNAEELSALTGLRPATLSEIKNMRRSAINVHHLMVLAKVLRIDDIGELFEIVVMDDSKEAFEKDKKVIEKRGLLPEQEEFLSIVRKGKKRKPTSK